MPAFRFSRCRAGDAGGLSSRLSGSRRHWDAPGKCLLGKIPDPFGPIAHDHLLFRTAPAAFPGFHVNSLSKLFGGFDGAGVGSRVRIADRIAFPVPGGLGEDASQLYFPRMGWLA